MLRDTETQSNLYYIIMSQGQHNNINNPQTLEEERHQEETKAPHTNTEERDCTGQRGHVMCLR